MVIESNQLRLGVLVPGVGIVAKLIALCHQFGSDAAKRSVRGCREAAGLGFGVPEDPSSGPSGHLLPEGEGAAVKTVLVLWV